MTLTEFLLARIAEDEAAAQAVPPLEEWESTDYADRFSSHASDHSYADSLFVGRFDPARILAECEAKRCIVERCRPLVAVVWWESDRLLASAFDETHIPTLAHSAPIWPNEHAEATLRDLALPYSNHPDYDEAWRP